VKIKNITYNPKGLKRADNVEKGNCTPKNDLNSQNITITVKDGYWKISKKI